MVWAFQVRKASPAHAEVPWNVPAQTDRTLLNKERFPDHQLTVGGCFAVPQPWQLYDAVNKELNAKAILRQGDINTDTWSSISGGIVSKTDNSPTFRKIEVFQKEIYNFENVYKCIQSTCTVFWTVIMYQNTPSFTWDSYGSWLQIQRSEFDSLRYQTFWEVVGLERGSLGLVITTEELLERKNSVSDIENRKYGRGIHCADHATPSIRKSWH
jgi:hypothetical protein